MAKLRPKKYGSSTPENKTLKSAEQLMKDAFAFVQANKTSEAVACCKKILLKHQVGETAESAGLLWVKLAPDDAAAWCSLGLTLFNNVKLQPAEQTLNIALRLNPNLAEAYNNQAMLQKFQGFLYEALQSYNQALTLEPNNKRYRTNRINVLLDMGLWDDAKTDVDWLQDKHPNDKIAQALTGRYYRSTGDFHTALPYLQNAYAQDPHNIAIMTNLVGCMGKLNTDTKQLYHMWKKLKKEIEDSPQSDFHGGEYSSIKYFIAMHEKTPLMAADLIVKGCNLDTITTAQDDITVTLLDDSRRLYEFKNYYTHSEEWTIYNNDRLFANMMVVGSKKHASFSDDGDVYLSESTYPQIHLQGPHVLLGGAENYYHWWIDFLPRLGVIQDFPELRHLPIIVLDTLNQSQLDAMEKLGVNLDRLVKIPVAHTVKCDHLIVPHLLGRPMTASGLPDWMKPMVNDWGVNWVREKFADWRQPNPQDPKRIFISRIGTKFRRCINEEEVYDIAKRYGFITLQNQNMNHQQQMALYSGAEMVMGPHGAGFTNMLFAPKGATAIEMFPKHRSPAFYNKLCDQLDQRYIKFDGPITRLLPGMSVDFGDFYIDPLDVERVLASL
jgi:tetratricopeptide (TPR) repeat protein